MKNEGKVFLGFILTIFVYGLLHQFDGIGRFVFSVDYSNFAVGIISLLFFFHKTVTKYSYLLIVYGFSLMYLLAEVEGFDLIDKSVFIQLRIGGLILFSFLLGYDLYKGKYSYYGTLLKLLIGLILIFFTFLLLKLDFAFNPVFSLVKNCLGFILIALIVRKEREEKRLPTSLFRLLIVIGMSFFVEIMGYVFT